MCKTTLRRRSSPGYVDIALRWESSELIIASIDSWDRTMKVTGEKKSFLPSFPSLKCQNVSSSHEFYIGSSREQAEQRKYRAVADVMVDGRG